MYNVPEQWITANKESLDSAIEFANITASGTEKLLDLNLKVSKAAFADLTKTAKSLASAKDVEALSEIQSSNFQPNAEKSLGYFRAVYGVIAETQGEIVKFVEDRVAVANKNFVTALEQAAKSAPGGSDVPVAAVKSVLAATNQAYDTLSKVVRQVNETTEAGFAAATQAPARKKAA